MHADSHNTQATENRSKAEHVMQHFIYAELKLKASENFDTFSSAILQSLAFFQEMSNQLLHENDVQQYLCL